MEGNRLYPGNRYGWPTDMIARFVKAAAAMFTRGFYSGWDRVPGAISGHAGTVV